MTDTRSLSIVMPTWDGGGSIPPVLTVARKLIARGHRVRVMGEACTEADARSAGAEFRQWTRAPSKIARTREYDFLEEWTAADPMEGIGRMIDRVMVNAAGDFARDLIEELRSDPADLVLTSDMLPGTIMACELLGQRVAILTCNVCLFPFIPGIPPLGPGLPPAETAEDEALHAEIAAQTEAWLDSRLPRLNEERASFGLPPVARFLDQLLRVEQHLLGTAQAFDFPTDDLPDNFRYVGPQLDDAQWSAPFVHPFPDDERPFALVSFSTTFQDHAAILQRTIDAIAQLPMTALVTRGGVIREDELRGAPNVAIVDSAPHSDVLRHAQLLVTHGGHGTLMKGVWAGLPMLVVPHGRDQEDNAVRVTHRGAGLKVAKSAAMDEIADALSHLLFEPGFAAAAADLGRKVREETARTDVVSEIERIAARTCVRMFKTA